MIKLKDNNDFYGGGGLLYKRYIEENFTNIKEFFSKYSKGTILVPLTPDPDSFLSNDERLKDDEPIGIMMRKTWDDYIDEMSLRGYSDKKKQKDSEELYKDIYDSRLFRIYLKTNKTIERVNVKKLGKRNEYHKGLVGTCINISEWIDTNMKKIPFKLAQKLIKDTEKIYDKQIGKRKLVIWIPLWQVSHCPATIFTVIDRVDIIIT